MTLGGDTLNRVLWGVLLVLFVVTVLVVVKPRRNRSVDRVSQQTLDRLNREHEHETAA